MVKEPRYRVLLVDNHPLFRAGVRLVIEAEKGMRVTGEASNSAEAQILLERQAFDIVLLDLVFLNGENGLDFLETLQAHHPGLPVLILSMHSEDQMAIRSIKAGARGYLCKDCKSDDLITALRKVAEGGSYITPSLAEKLAESLMVHEKPLHEYLSKREREVLSMLVMGYTVTQIAPVMNVSVKTISTHKSRIFEKMHFTSTHELVKYAFQFNLVDGLNFALKSEKPSKTGKPDEPAIPPGLFHQD